jgi:hypothetical protein
MISPPGLPFVQRKAFASHSSFPTCPRKAHSYAVNQQGPRPNPLSIRKSSDPNTWLACYVFKIFGIAGLDCPNF